MRITCLADCVSAVVSGRTSPELLDTIDRVLTFQEPGAWFTPQYKRGVWDGKRHLFKLSAQTFPVGLLDRVLDKLRANELEPEVVDQRPPVPAVAPVTSLKGFRPGEPTVITLHEDQVQALTGFLGVARGCLQLPTGCLAGDVKVGINRAGKSFTLPIRDLVRRFNGARITWGRSGRVSAEQGAGMHWNEMIPTMIRARDFDGTIRLFPLLAAQESGAKLTYTVRLQFGREVRATADHRFLTPGGWKELREVHVGDNVYVECRRHPVHAQRKKPVYRQVGGLKLHPFAGRRGVRPGKGGFSVPLHRLVVEAGLNNMSYEVFVGRLRAGDTALIFLDPRRWEVHHIDENYQNNAWSNLAVFPRDGSHQAHHGRSGRWRDVTAVTTTERVVAVEEHRAEATFDLALGAEPFNFLANGFVVHNSGKTELAASLFKTFPDERGLMICDRKTLLRQTAERLEGRLGEQVGLIGGGREDVNREGRTRYRVTVATIQSLWHHYDRYSKELYPSIGMLVVDEAHTISPKSWFQTLAVIPAPVRLGLSATIKEAVRRMMVEAYLGPIVHEQQMTDLIETGRLAFPNVAMLRIGGLVGEESGPQQAYTEGIVENRRRNEAVVSATILCQAQKKPVLILVVRIEHGHKLRRMFEAGDMDVPFVWGDSHPEAIQQGFRDLEGGRVPALIMSTIGDRGIDLPAIRALIIASGQRSALLTIQRIGRAVRKKVGENTVDILDFADMSCHMLRSQADDRRRTFARKGLAPRVINTIDEWLR